MVGQTLLAYEVAKQRSNASVGGLRASKADAVLRHLGDVPIFATCTKRELKAIAKAAIIEQRASGATLCVEGEIGSELYVILQGNCRVTRKGRKVADLGPGGVVGELSVLTRAERNATVAASSPLEIAILRRRELFDVLAESPSFTRKLLESLATRVQTLDAKQLS